jgi:predicted dehydrogenase
METKRASRRDFIKTTVLASAATVSIPLIIPAKSLGRDGYVAPSDRITFGAIGMGNRCMTILPEFMKEKDLQCLAICDAFSNRRKDAKKIVDKTYDNGDCDAYRYHEELLDRKDIDAVILATGDRGHAVLSVIAAKAGKDVYSEKPFTLTIGEGRTMVDAMNKYKRVWQCGTQRSSNDRYKFISNSVLEGKIGKLQTASAILGPGFIDNEVEEMNPLPKKEIFDYDQWLCQAPYASFSKARVKKWRQIWATGGGLICDMGPHYIDAIQSACGFEKELPIEYEGTALWPNTEGIVETPFDFNVKAKYENGINLIMKKGNKGILFEGDEGWMHITDPGVITASNKSLLEGCPELRSWTYIRPHIRDFVDSIKTRDLNTVSNPERAQRIHTICHCANIGLRLGRKVRWNYTIEKFVDDDEANSMLNRKMRKGWDISEISKQN